MAFAILYHCLRAPLGLVFVCTGFIKLMDIPDFANHLGDFGIVPDGLVPAVAWLVSLSELVAGLGLVANIRGSLAIVFCILMIFIGVLAYGIVLGLDIDCGCLGPDFSVGLKTQLLIDIGLVAWCGLAYLMGNQCKVRFDKLAAVALSTSNRRGKTL